MSILQKPKTLLQQLTISVDRLDKHKIAEINLEWLAIKLLWEQELVTFKHVRYYEMEDLPNEEWKPLETHKIVKGLYLISNLGRVKSLVTHRILKPSENSCRGYLYVTLPTYDLHGETRLRHERKFKIHRLVAEYFLPDFVDDKYHSVDHRFQNLYDNRAMSLDIKTYSEQMKNRLQNCVEIRFIKQLNSN